MAPTTFRSFVDALEAMTVTGVSRKYTHGPPSGSPTTADCPAGYYCSLGCCIEDIILI